MLRSKSDPTPPSSRSFTPAVRSTSPLIELIELMIELTSIAFTDKAPSRSRWVFDLPITVTLLSATESFISLCCLLFCACAHSTNRDKDIHNSFLTCFLLVLIDSFLLNPVPEVFASLVRHGRFDRWSNLACARHNSSKLGSALALAGFLALSEKSAFPSCCSVAAVWTFHNGDDSSGYCSGLSPDSLLCTWWNTKHITKSLAKIRIKNGTTKRQSHFIS